MSPASLLWLLTTALAGSIAAEHATVAVAANFAEVVERLKADFERQSGHSLAVVAGSTGKLYAQISQGAPFDVYLSADQQSPERLEATGLAVSGSRFTYAIGRLTLWSPEPGLLGENGPAILEQGRFRLLGLANPALAPYGEAARQTLEKLGLWQRHEGRMVMGETIGQAFAMVASGNAELGLVALSSVLSPRNQNRGSRWDVPSGYHAPLRQDAVLLARAANNAAALAFLSYLKGPEAMALLQSYGYETPTP